jgi:hypothetical protein
MLQPLAHMDAVRVSLSQLFLTADLVAITRIESVAERTFADAENSTRYEVVTASVLTQYKGQPVSRVEFFQDAHGHAYYRAGDTAVLFLEQMTEAHQLYDTGKMGNVRYVSHQVRNTEHRVSPGDRKDYEWVLSAYAETPTATTSNAKQRSQKIKQIILRMLASNSQDMTESALLDWENIGHGFQLSDEDVEQLLALTRDPEKQISLRLAILRALSRRNLVSEEAWVYLLKHEDNEDLLQVLRSTQGYENTDFMGYLIALLDHPSGSLAEGAARALGHPAYAGAEPSLKSLLNSDNLRLNYAAVSALLGIDSQEARALVQDAAANHPNAKVRRMISAQHSINPQQPLNHHSIITILPPPPGNSRR